MGKPIALGLIFSVEFTTQPSMLACIYALYIDQPRFTRNLTCIEESGQLWRCMTHASGTNVKYRWFINDELLSNDDNRVFSIVRSSIVLHNLEPSDMHLMVQVYNTKDQRIYRIAQSAAILVPAESCATTTPSPRSDG